jgi:hypothetical protein
VSPDPTFWLALAAKMAATAAVVVFASFIAERGGALIGAMIASLPISAGPAYVFLALDHDTHFLAASATASLVSNSVTVVFALAYSVLAQRLPMFPALAGALATWIVLWLALWNITWTLDRAALLALAIFAVCVPLGNRYRQAAMPAPIRRWYDLPVRAGMVAVLVCGVVTLGSRLGADAAGVLAVFPVVFTSLIVILHPRMGGRATAAVLANAILGLVGLALAFTVVHATVEAMGAGAALSIGLAIAIAWNVTVWALRRRGLAF